MRKTLTPFLFILLQLTALAATEHCITDISQEADALVIRFELNGFSLTEQEGKAEIEIAGMQLSSYAGQPQVPFSSYWLELPPEGDLSLELQAESTSFYPDLTPVNYLDDEVAENRAAGRANLDSFAALGEPGWMRDLRLVSLTIQPVKPERGGISVLESGTIRIRFHRPTPYQDLSYSGEMEELYSSILLNHGQFATHRDETMFPRMLIVGSPFYDDPASIGDLLEWKRRAGFEVDFVTFDQMPGGGNTITPENLDSWLTGYYEQYQPEYLILIGDHDGTYACPAFLIPESEGEDYNVTDLQYSLKVGDDYFPDLFLGRLSVHDALVQLQTIVDKIVHYESEPFQIGNPDYDNWLERGLVVGGNYAEGATTPITPVLTSRWVRERLLDNGYAQVDTVYYPPHISGEPMISNTINSGVGVVNYRGWADAEHWQRPSYSITDMNNNLNNYYMTPIMLSIVCNTGDFGHVAHEPCFAEAFLRLGSPGTPNGGVAVLAPSDLHTRSIYNNAINAGFYRGLFNEGITTMGGNVVRAKIDLYNGFPNEQELNGYVFFYFNVYNLLGDPSMRIRTAVPEQLQITADDTLAVGSTSYVLQVTSDQGSPMENLLVTLVSGDSAEELLARGRTDAAGNLTLHFDRLEQTGTVQLTIMGNNSYPHLADLPVVVRPQFATLVASDWLEDGSSGSSGNGDQLINPGETVAWFPTLLNSGSETITSITLTATAAEEYLTLQSNELTFGELASGAQATSAEPLLLDLSQSVLHGWPLQLDLHISGDQFAQDSRDQQSAVASRPYFLSSTLLEDDNQLIDPEETVELQLTLANDGALPTSYLTATLATTLTDLTVITTGPQAFGVIEVDGEASAQYQLQGEINILPGIQMPLQLELNGSDAFHQLLDIDLINGDRVTGDPTGPDGYGYWAYESRDYNYQNRPEYNWEEIDTRLGGEGTRLWLDDDQSETIGLPFSFRYYGVDFDTITVCSNGWISMGRTWMADFTNWMIPPGLGPANMIMPFWDDLKPVYTPEEDSVWVPVFHKDMGDGRFIIEWSETYNRYLWDSEPMEETFQLILYDPAQYPTATGDGQMLFQYRVIADEDARANYATVGITDHDHFHGLEVTFGQRYGPDAVLLADRTAILVTTDPPLRVTDPQIILEGEISRWFHTVTPQLNWNPGPLSGDPDYSYTLEIALDDTLNEMVQIHTGIVEPPFDITDPLEEQVEYFWRVTAYSDDDTVACAPGYLNFTIDATPPEAELGLIGNPVYPHYLDLGIVSSEELSAEPMVVIRDSDSAQVDSSRAEALPQTPTGFHYTLNLETLGEYQLDLQMVDISGLPGGQNRDLALGGPGYSGTTIGDDITLEWLSGSDLFAMETEAGVELAGSGSYRMSFSGEGIICRFENGSWRQLAPEGVREIVIQQGGHYAQRTDADLLPQEVVLRDNYPNPFNGSTRLEFSLPERAAMQLSVYNLLGQQVEVLLQGTLDAGVHLQEWRPSGYASGMYWAVLRVEGEATRATRIQKMLYLK